MELKNCPECGKLFVYSVREICPDCAQKDEENLEKVRDYLYKNANATIEEISEETGVPTNKILGYLKDGHLMLKEGNPFLLVCEKCKTPILTGRYCDKCKEELKRKLSKTSETIEPNTKLTGKIHLTRFKKD